MGYKFDQSSLAIQHIQIMLNETYNSNIVVNGKYYTKFDMNYGMAHYIAKYLEYKYPPCSLCAHDYSEIVNPSSTINRNRMLTAPISLLNYFLSDNLGNHLKHSIIDSDNHVKIDKTFDLIYNTYMRANPIFNQTANYSIYGSFFNTYDQPLFETVPVTDLMYPISDNGTIIYPGDTGNIGVSCIDADGSSIFNLQSWNIEKGICELDDFVLSYLLDRTITEYSSKEEIYYVQKLLINPSELAEKEKGVWKTDLHDLTAIICNFQKNHVNRYKNTPIFVTGYFDIFTESAALFEYESSDSSVYGI